MVESFGQECRQTGIVNQLPCDTNTLIKAHEMGAGIDMSRKPCGLNCAAQEGAGRTLAIGARDMKDRREVMMRVTKPVQQACNAFKAQNILAGR